MDTPDPYVFSPSLALSSQRGQDSGEGTAHGAAAEAPGVAQVKECMYLRMLQDSSDKINNKFIFGQFCCTGSILHIDTTF